MTQPDFTNYGYQINLELGHNRAGGRITYQATEINTQNSVVVKQFQFARTGSNWADYDAYEREIQVLKALDHPSIPRYLDSFQTPSGFCMIQEYKNAPSLATPRIWQPHQVKQIAIAVLEILKYLQNRIPPVIHRDLKPENILVDSHLNVSLVDFGFARLGGGEVAVSSVVKGTLGFMPPEQMFNRQLTTASDLYSLGATLICLLTDTKSTEIGNLIDDNGKINFKAKVPHLSEAFIQWLEKMVEPHYKNRFKSAEAALDAVIPIEVLRPSFAPKKSLWIKLGMTAVSVGILMSMGMNYLEIKSQSRQKSSYSSSITVNLPSEPYYNPSQIVMGDKKINFNVTLSNLKSDNYLTLCQLSNSSGKLVAVGQSILKPTDGKLVAECGYQFNPREDHPGDWRFEFFLDGQKTAEKTLTVLSN
ncbi:serine/threonine protein kinase [Gloeothece citriformis PCC 7424]|uniref:non-specific serine/threonine protein kinase n=1 Tax=Gloeothece citriformis (strain PCC 7424) TaxID=65393 RepID=B7K7D8_GLOC7|nr:serine/threonine-protein kinase [Gloeothece citriformis]ACK69706.1 serine/threonine protein kinase [Gloeothece citriformis PCC 7424]